MSRKAIIITSVAIIAVAGLSLGGWAIASKVNDSFHIGGGTSVAAVTSTPTSTPTPTPTVVPIGGVLDENTALDLRREMPDNGDYAYKLPDGRWVKTNRNQPLPAEVLAAEQAIVDQIPVQQGTGPNDAVAGAGAAIKAAGAAGYRTGRRTLLISLVPVASGHGSNALRYIIAGDLAQNLPHEIGGNGWTDPATAVQKAQALIAAAPDAANWDIIVAHQH